MALLKNIKYSNGTETNYHKISEIRVIPFTKETIVKYAENPSESNVYEQVKLYKIETIVRSYVTRDIRDNNEYNYLAIKKYEHEATEKSVEMVPIMKLAYDALKLTTDFEDAEDI